MRFHFGKLNVFLFVLGIIFLIAGYIMMGAGDKTFAPVILVLAYAVLCPLSLILGFNKKE